MRHYATLLHRFVGLALAGLLLLAGITGSILVWYHELDEAFNPGVMRATAPVSGAQALGPLALRERLLASNPGASINLVELERVPGAAAKFILQQVDGAGQTQYEEVFVDPYSAHIQGRRVAGKLSQFPLDLMPFIFELHFALALGTTGTWVLGIAALLWTLDCFVGAFLTFPLRGRQGTPASAHKGWPRRWTSAWKVRTGSAYKLTFDLHRAGGLWLWAILFVIAWSAVGFNLQQAYRPVMEALFDHQDELQRMPKTALATGAPMGWEQALTQGRLLMAREAEQQGFSVLQERLMSFDAKRALYRLRVKSDRDLSGQKGNTSLYFDAVTGERRALFLPTGRASGDTVSTWLFGLHMAQVWGLPFRIFITITGIAVAMLSTTGVLIWLRKRRGRVHADAQVQRQARHSAALAGHRR